MWFQTHISQKWNINIENRINWTILKEKILENFVQMVLGKEKVTIWIQKKLVRPALGIRREIIDEY